MEAGRWSMAGNMAFLETSSCRSLDGEAWYQDKVAWGWLSHYRLCCLPDWSYLNVWRSLWLYCHFPFDILYQKHLVRASFLHRAVGTLSAAVYAGTSVVAAATRAHWSTEGYTYLQMARRYQYPCRLCGDAKAACARRHRAVRARWLHQRHA